MADQDLFAKKDTLAGCREGDELLPHAAPSRSGRGRTLLAPEGTVMLELGHFHPVGMAGSLYLILRLPSPILPFLFHWHLVTP